MGFMNTAVIGAAAIMLYRSGRLNPYIQQVKDSPYFKQLKDRAGWRDGGAQRTPPQEAAGSTTIGAEPTLPRT